MSSPLLERLLDPAPLEAASARAAFERVVDPAATEVERAAILVALAARSLSAREVAEFVGAMRARATRFPVPARDRPVDLCGSGGAPRPSFNVSTVSALVVAASGVPVVKHGNRSARGICGSSDLLEALGLPVTRSRSFSEATYRSHRIAFLHAPLYHPAAGAVASVRQALGVPTIFNLLGPLTNPAAVPFQVVGAPNGPTAETFSKVLVRLGVRRGISMWSDDGCDEFSPRARTCAYLWENGSVRRRSFFPDTLLEPDDRRGEWGALPPLEAAEEAERILAGGGGARRGSVLLTSAAALYLVGTARSFSLGVDLAAETLDRGRAARLLADLRRLARRYPKEAT